MAGVSTQGRTRRFKGGGRLPKARLLGNRTVAAGLRQFGFCIQLKSPLYQGPGRFRPGSFAHRARAGHQGGQFCLHFCKQALPISTRGLAEQAHGRIPGGISAVQQPTPLRHILQAPATPQRRATIADSVAAGLYRVLRRRPGGNHLFRRNIPGRRLDGMKRRDVHGAYGEDLNLARPHHFAGIGQ
jgi:hypothetical protein